MGDENRQGLVRPSFLSEGDVIGLLAPARKVSRTEMDNALAWLKAHGYRISEGRHLYGDHHQFSGSDSERTADLQLMLDDPEIRSILCARGGYGTSRIIDKLDFSAFVRSPKWIIGFSDITVLQMHIATQYGIQSLHAPMALTFGEASGTNTSLHYLSLALKGGLSSYELPTHPMSVRGSAEGVLLGGNLSILVHLAGTPSLPDFRNAILFIEDVDEYLYHIDRMMTQLSRMGILDRIRGMIVGSFNRMRDNDIAFGMDAQAIILEKVKKLKIPVIFDFPAGHETENWGLYIGSRIEIQVEGKSSFLRFRDTA